LSEVPKNYKELLLYTLAKVVDARVNIEREGLLYRNLKYLCRYYSAILVLVNLASQYLDVEGLLEKASKAWENYDPENPRTGPTTKALDGVLREIVSQLVSAGAI